MPSVRYFNQTAPFWDFVANLEEQGASHPFFGGNDRGEASENENERPNPWTNGWAGFPWGPIPHRGRHGPHGPHPPPPPPQPHHEGAAPPPGPEGESDPEAGPSDEAHQGQRAHHGRRDHHHGPHAFGRGRHGMGGRGGHGFGRRHFHPYAMGGLGGLAEMFQNQFFNNENTVSGANNNSNDFTPEVDVFDASESFVIHVSLPGAKKEDIAVSWDAERSELAISGVVHRPGDEELLKTISLGERKVGAFERKIRLGSRANPAQVEADGISARMEDGVLRVEVPKLDAGYVEIKKVDIE